MKNIKKSCMVSLIIILVSLSSCNGDKKRHEMQNLNENVSGDITNNAKYSAQIINNTEEIQNKEQEEFKILQSKSIKLPIPKFKRIITFYRQANICDYFLALFCIKTLYYETYYETDSFTSLISRSYTKVGFCEILQHGISCRCCCYCCNDNIVVVSRKI